MKEPLIEIMIDAFSFSYFSLDEIKSFTSNLSEFECVFQMVPNHGFDNYTSLFTGLKPKELDTLTHFIFSPENSRFNKLKFLTSIFELFPKQSFIRGAFSRILRKFTKDPFVKTFGHLHNIPWKILPYVDYNPNQLLFGSNYHKSHPTLFKTLREKGFTFEWIGYPKFKNDHSLINYIKTRKNVSDFTFIHLSDLDPISHKNGAFHKNTINKALNSLKNAEIIIDHVKKIQPGCKILLFSDHGMSDVTNYINVLEIVKKTRLRVPQDIIPFIDSTFARFWCFNEQSRQELLEELQTNPSINLFDETIARRIGLSLSDYFGHIISYVNPGNLFFPNHFDSVKNIKGMHGYLEKDPEEFAFLSVREEDKFIIEDNLTPKDSPIEWYQLFKIHQNYFGNK